MYDFLTYIIEILPVTTFWVLSWKKFTKIISLLLNLQKVKNVHTSNITFWMNSLFHHRQALWIIKFKKHKSKFVFLFLLLIVPSPLFSLCYQYIVHGILTFVMVLHEEEVCRKCVYFYPILVSKLTILYPKNGFLKAKETMGKIGNEIWIFEKPYY